MARASLYFEDFQAGQSHTLEPRLFPAEELDGFCRATGRQHPLHLDDDYARRLGFRGRIAPGVQSLSILSNRLADSGLIANLIAILGFDRVRFLGPLYAGETLGFQVQVVERKESSRGDRGTVTFHCRGTNRQGEPLLEADVTVLLRKR
ncbi:MAG: MaoC family dehydratase [Euryarchaeota archaeon]|nr:MaoC family dehydratase [Euryarchaeota archaeon]